MSCITLGAANRPQSGRGFPETTRLGEHLTQLQIENYVSRSGGVDEILTCAEHLDACFDCRDRAAALVDSGAGEISHTRRGRNVKPQQKPSTFAIVAPWIIVGIILVAIAWWLVSRV